MQLLRYREVVEEGVSSVVRHVMPRALAMQDRSDEKWFCYLRLMDEQNRGAQI